MREAHTLRFVRCVTDKHGGAGTDQFALTVTLAP